MSTPVGWWPQRRLASLALTATLAWTAACTAGDGPPEGASTPTSPATPGGPAGPSPEPPEPPAPPPSGACYRLSVDAAARPSSTARPVRCSRAHTALTFEVGRLHRILPKPSPDLTSPAAQRRLARTCTQRLDAFLGGEAQSRRLSRFTTVWFIPTAAEVAAGARWYRCDVVALASLGELLRLPTQGRLRNVLDRPDALDTYGLCGTAAPGTEGFRRVACARPHAWRAISTISLPGRRYPGVARARAAGDDACADQARSRMGFVLEFRYGWEWPTAAQWAEGQHYGYCWAPVG